MRSAGCCAVASCKLAMVELMLALSASALLPAIRADGTIAQLHRAGLIQPLGGCSGFPARGLPVAPSPFPSEDEPNSCQRSMWGSDSGGRSRLGPMMLA